MLIPEKWKHAYKSFASFYYVEILNTFNLELQFNGSESTIKRKLIDLLAHLKGFKLVTKLVLVFKKMECED